METIFVLIILLFSIIIHEIAHGSIANLLGDPTAKLAGRLTLNPSKHLDIFGSIILPLLFLFFYALAGTTGPIVGWAKPVPINPHNFRDKKWGTLKVSIAGPAVNFLIAIIFGLLIRFFGLFSFNSLGVFIFLFSRIAIYNFLWGIFNLVPIPPLDGSHILFRFFPEKWNNVKFFLHQYSVFLLIFLIFILPGLYWIFFGAAVLYYFVSGQPFI